jgi:hypothetical protein
MTGWHPIRSAGAAATGPGRGAAPDAAEPDWSKASR